jgi:ADP-ribose pyrophosphatase YjhB (NUDIX family)
MSSTRLAVRAVIFHEDGVLLVNAYPDGLSDLWCAPGGGVTPGLSLADNLIREVREETGLAVRPGPLIHVAEFHDPDAGFHQVELFFRTALVAGTLSDTWVDPEGIVTERRFFTEAALAGIRFKPDVLPRLAFGAPPSLSPGALERKAP